MPPVAFGGQLPPYAFPFPSAFPMPLFPNPVLFVENLPAGVTVNDLTALFSPHAGYVESRLVPVKEGVAFVEFEDEEKATQVLSVMQGFKVAQGHDIRISYAKK